jgi:tRNA (guanine37-N1)-methyltransferase
MRFDVLTLFPELFEPFTRIGVTRRAYDEGRLVLQTWQPRDFTEDNYRRCDDRPFGGGPGMVMLAEPLQRTLLATRAARRDAGVGEGPVILFSPAGVPLTQGRVEALARSDGAVLLCGRYEGLDQRFIDRHVDEELSLGDFVLSGGELPALALVDAVARLLPGVLGDAASHQQDSFSDGLLDCPHYSRPEVWEGDAVPTVLMSGHHAHIARWRRQQQLRLTAERRPELIAAARAAGRLDKEDEQTLRKLGL